MAEEGYTKTSSNVLRAHLEGLPALDALRIARALKEYSQAGAEFVTPPLLGLFGLVWFIVWFVR